MGVNVTLSDAVPSSGPVPGVVQAKVPPTEAEPPVNVEEAKVCPYVMVLAVGHAVTVGVALFTITLIEVLTVL